MKKILPFLIVPVFAGCLSSKQPLVADWPIPTEIPLSMSEMQVMQARASARFGLARLSQLVVRAPYDSRSLQVLRADGTLASDPYNRFAAAPSQLLKGSVQDLLGASPRFTALVGSSSAATASHIVEVTVTKLLLDCTAEEKRAAEVAATVLVLDRDRRIVWTGAGLGRADAKDGNFGRAFAKALELSLDAALVGKQG